MGHMERLLHKGHLPRRKKGMQELTMEGDPSEVK